MARLITVHDPREHTVHAAVHHVSQLQAAVWFAMAEIQQLGRAAGQLDALLQLYQWCLGSVFSACGCLGWVGAGCPQWPQGLRSNSLGCMAVVITMCLHGTQLVIMAVHAHPSPNIRLCTTQLALYMMCTRTIHEHGAETPHN